MFEDLITGILEARQFHRQPAEPGGVPATGAFVLGKALPFGSMGPEPGTDIELSDDLMSKHIFCVAGSGGGKTTFQSRLMSHDWNAGKTTLSLDFLGDGAERNLRNFANSEFETGSRIALVDFLDDRFVPDLNVLRGPGTPQARASAMHDAMKAEAEGWGTRIGYNCRFGTEALAWCGLGITEMQELFCGDGRLRGEAMAAMPDGPSRQALAAYCDLAAEQKAQQWMELASKVFPWVSDPKVAPCLGRPSMLDLSQLLDSPGRSTLISLGVSRFPAANLCGKLILAAVERHVMARAEIPEGRRNGFRIYLDEARRVSGFGLESLLAEGRRMKCACWVATQQTSMLDPAFRSALRANCSVMVMMAAGGAEGAELAGEIVTDLPREKVRQELVSLKVGEAIVVRRGMPAAKCLMPDFPVPKVDDAVVDALRLRAMAETGVTVEQAASEAASLSERLPRASAVSGVGRGGVVHRSRPLRKGGRDG